MFIIKGYLRPSPCYYQALSFYWVSKKSCHILTSELLLKIQDSLYILHPARTVSIVGSWRLQARSRTWSPSRRTACTSTPAPSSSTSPRRPLTTTCSPSTKLTNKPSICTMPPLWLHGQNFGKQFIIYQPAGFVIYPVVLLKIVEFNCFNYFNDLFTCIIWRIITSLKKDFCTNKSILLIWKLKGSSFTDIMPRRGRAASPPPARRAPAPAPRAAAPPPRPAGRNILY